MDQALVDELLNLIASGDGSARSRMMIASRALWLAALARKPAQSEEEWKASVSRYVDDCLRLGVALDLAIDGMRPPNPYKARLAQLGPALESLTDKLDAVMLDPAASLADLRKTVEEAIHDPAMVEAGILLDKARRLDT